MLGIAELLLKKIHHQDAKGAKKSKCGRECRSFLGRSTHALRVCFLKAISNVES
jgi:hypothetical protein